MVRVDYTWDRHSDNVLMESDENGDTTAVYTNEPDQYGELLSQRRDNATSYYQFDGQGSTRQLTNEIETVTDAATYSAFGEEVAKSGATTNPFGYKGAAGYYTNTETDDVYVRARTYQPAFGRWLSIGISDLGVSNCLPNGYAITLSLAGVMSQPINRQGADGVTFGECDSNEKKCIEAAKKEALRLLSDQQKLANCFDNLLCVSGCITCTSNQLVKCLIHTLQNVNFDCKPAGGPSITWTASYAGRCMNLKSQIVKGGNCPSLNALSSSLEPSLTNCAECKNDIDKANRDILSSEGTSRKSPTSN